MRIIVFLLVLLIAASAEARDWYATPTGNSINPCTTASPCAFDNAFLNKAAPGDNLILRNGTYNKIVNDNVCPGGSGASTGISNGTSDTTRITLKAENERQATVRSDDAGSFRPAIYMASCRYWTIYGIVWSSPSNQNPLVQFDDVHFLKFQRNIVIFSNNTGTEHPLSFTSYVGNNDNVLVEENEIYNFYREAFSFKGFSNSEVRRNYCNVRTATVPPGVGDPNPAGAPASDPCIIMYPGDHNIVENNFSEGIGGGWGVEPAGNATGNTFYGNAFIGGHSGIVAEQARMGNTRIYRVSKICGSRT